MEVRRQFYKVTTGISIQSEEAKTFTARNQQTFPQYALSYACYLCQIYGLVFFIGFQRDIFPKFFFRNMYMYT